MPESESLACWPVVVSPFPVAPEPVAEAAEAAEAAKKTQVASKNRLQIKLKKL